MPAVLDAETLDAEIDEALAEDALAAEATQSGEDQSAEDPSDEFEISGTVKPAKAGKAKSPASALDIRVDSKVLLSAVQSVLRAVPSRASLPILQHIRLTAATDGRIELLATDLERFISCSISADVVSPGSVTLPAKWVQELLSRLPPASLRLSVDAEAEGGTGVQRQCRLKCAGSNYKVLGFDAEEFPVFPVTEAETSLTMGANDFCQALGRTVFSCSKDESRAILTGLLIEYECDGVSDGSLGLVATDTYRLARSFCTVRHSTGKSKNSPAEARSAIVPQTALLDIAALAKSAADVTMSFVRSKSNQVTQVRFDIARKPPERAAMRART